MTDKFAKQTDKILVPQCLSNLVSFKKSAPILTFPHRGRKIAFTLVEVLITLGIIGVVAAITLPALINNIQDRQNIAKWKKEYSVISNAFNSVLADGLPVCVRYHANGSCIDDGVSGGYIYFSDDFIMAMKDKLKVSSYCSGMHRYTPQCDNYTATFTNSGKKNIKYYWSGVANVYTRYKSLASNQTRSDTMNEYGISAHNLMHYAFLLSDGAAVYFGGLWNGPWIVVDVNNFNSGPNEIGRDVFVIKVFSNINTSQHHLKPAGVQGTPNWNNPDSGSFGCSKDIGLKAGGTIYDIAGAGCSAYYLYSK